MPVLTFFLLFSDICTAHARFRLSPRAARPYQEPLAVRLDDPEEDLQSSETETLTTYHKHHLYVTPYRALSRLRSMDTSATRWASHRAPGPEECDFIPLSQHIWLVHEYCDLLV